MNIETDTWYDLARLLEPLGDELGDGSSVFVSNNRFHGGQLQALMGVTGVSQWSRSHVPTSYPYLQLSLLDVAREEVDGFPDTITRHLLREYMVCLDMCDYAFDVLLQADQVAFYASGVVCACMLEFDPAIAKDSDKKHREVEMAYRRGLLDTRGRDIADGRIRAKPVRQELESVKRAGYLPDNAWRMEVVFAHWYDLQTDELAVTPLHDLGDLEHLRIQFKARERQKNFRVVDLFSS